MPRGILPTLTPTHLAAALLGTSSQLEMFGETRIHLYEFLLYITKKENPALAG
jgi:hypothetical protein